MTMVRLLSARFALAAEEGPFLALAAIIELAVAYLAPVVACADVEGSTFFDTVY
jgi:hypothetical protein